VGRPIAGECGIIEAMTGANTITPDRARVDDAQARAVVDAVLRGDRDAFRALVDRESRSVVRLCFRILGDIHEAEDAAQESFVTAYRSLATWRGDGPFGGWLATIATRIAIRRASRRKPVVRLDAPVGEGDPGAAADAILARSVTQGDASAATDPSIRALQAERSDAVRRAVARLDEPYREVVALRFFGDRSLAEIADESGRPIGTVKTHLHRGLKRLRGLLASEGIDA
jgi:RNA polymerase sigma-70 factor (ECF subfamily)